jgi:hypothetical protein
VAAQLNALSRYIQALLGRRQPPKPPPAMPRTLGPLEQVEDYRRREREVLDKSLGPSYSELLKNRRSS